MSKKDILEQFNLAPTTLTEERETYIERKTGIDRRTIKKILEVETEYTAKCLASGKSVNLLGRCKLKPKYEDYKGREKFHIVAQAPKRLYRAIEKIEDNDIKEEKLNMAVQEITYLN